MRRTQQVALHIKDGYGIRRETLNGAAHQVLHRGHIARRQMGSGLQLHHDAGLGRFARVDKNRILGKRDVNARLFHFSQGAERTFQLALKRSRVVDVLHKFRCAQIGLIKNFEPDSSRLREAGGSKLQAQFREFRGGNRDNVAGIRQSVFRSRFLQFLNDGGGIFGCKAGVECFEVGFFPPVNQ